MDHDHPTTGADSPGPDPAEQYTAELKAMPRSALIAHALYNGEFASALVTQVSTRATQLAMLPPTDEPVEKAFRAGLTQALSWMGEAMTAHAGRTSSVPSSADEHLYVDMDSGTVLTGPVYTVPAYLLDSEISDGQVIDLAQRYGEPATPDPDWNGPAD